MMCHTWVRRVSTSLSPFVNDEAGAKLDWVAAKLGWLAANLGWSVSTAYSLHRLPPAKGTLIPN